MKTAEQLLDEAGQFLADKKRWCKGGMYSPDLQASCALGALHRAYYRAYCIINLDHRDAYEQARRILRDVVVEHYPEFEFAADKTVLAVAQWNDAPERQHHEVVEMFEKARALAAEKG